LLRFGEGYGNMTYLDETYLSPLDTPALCGIMAAIVQMFYAFRIVSLRKSLRWVAGWICLTSATQTVAALISAVKAYQKSHFSLFHNDYPITVAFLIWNIAGFVSDVTIAIAMLYIFRASRLRVDQSTATILSRVVRVILETNALTATIAMVSLIMFVLFPTKSYFICSTFVMGKLYSNTLLVTFNNRLALRRIPDSIGFGLSTSNAVSQSFYFSTIMDIDRDEFAASGHHLSRVSHATQSESSKSRTYEGGKPALQSENSTYSIGRDIDRAEYAQDGSSLGTTWSKGSTTGGGSGGKVLEDEVSRRTEINSSPC
jgi:uncharacterized membrane protein